VDKNFLRASALCAGCSVIVVYSYAGRLKYLKSRYRCSIGSSILNAPIKTLEARSTFSNFFLPQAVFIGRWFSTKSMVLIRITLYEGGSREESVLRY